MDLPIRQLEVHPAELRRLEDQPQRSTFVSGSLIRGDHREDIRVGYRGNRTRQAPKRSFEVRRQTGTLHYNAEYDDPSLLRNALSFWFFRKLGLPVPQTTHCLLYLNGRLLGVYLEIEGVDSWFFHLRGLSCQSLFYAVNHDANFGVFQDGTRRLKPSLFDGYELVVGGKQAQQRFERFIFELNLQRGTTLRTLLQEQLDIDAYLRWLAGTVCVGHADGLTQNYAIWSPSETGRYQLIPWDCEGTWGRNCFGALCPVDAVDTFGENVLSAKLLQFPQVRSAYRTLLRQLTDTLFTDVSLMPVISAWMQRIGPAILTDTTRKHREQWFAEMTVFRQYIRDRRLYLLEALARDETSFGP